MLLLLQAHLELQVPGGREGVVGMYYYMQTLLFFYSQDFCSLPLLETGPELGSCSDPGRPLHTPQDLGTSQQGKHVKNASLTGSSFIQPPRFINLVLVVPKVGEELVPEVQKSTCASGVGQLQSRWELPVHTQPFSQIQIKHCNPWATATLPSIITARSFILVLKILSDKVGKCDFSLFSCKNHPDSYPKLSAELQPYLTRLKK